MSLVGPDGSQILKTKKSRTRCLGTASWMASTRGRCGRFRTGLTVIPLYVIGLAQWVTNTTNRQSRTLCICARPPGWQVVAMRPIPEWGDRHPFICDRFGPMGRVSNTANRESSDTMHGHCFQNGKSWRWQNLSMQNEGLQGLQEPGDELHGGQSFCQDVRRAVQWLRVYAACCLHLVPPVNGHLCHSLHRHLCRVALPPLGGICAKTSCGIWLPCDFGWPGGTPGDNGLFAARPTNTKSQHICSNPGRFRAYKGHTACRVQWPHRPPLV